MIKDNQNYNDNVEPNTEFLNELKNKLPEYFSKDGKFDMDKFKNNLKDNNINELKDGYQLNFIGKDYARRQSGELPHTVVVPDEEQNNGEGKDSKNIFFTGDNLEVLRHLQGSYLNKIDMIYIDPPYNTGNGDFVYPDKFEYTDKKLSEIFGLNDEELKRLNSLNDSSSHSAWLTFMYPRLVLAKHLMKDDSVILISIDDNEQSNLRQICDEIFGEQNLISQICHKSRASISNDKIISNSHNTILCYGKNERKIFKKRSEIGIDPNLSGYNLSDDNGPYKLVPVDGPGGAKKGNPYYNFLGIEKYWRFSKKKMEEMYKKGLIVKTSNNLQQKYYLSNARKSRKTVNSWWDEKFYSSTATSRLSKMMGGNYFDTPKPVDLILKMLEMFTFFNDKAVILDFFAGSSTTAEAVMKMNQKHGGNRKFIMVQLPEKTFRVNSKTGEKIPTSGGKEAFNAGYNSIDEISRERIKKAATEIIKNNTDELNMFDGSFKHYRIAEIPNKTLDKISDFNEDDLYLFNDMLSNFSSDGLDVPGNASGESTILCTWMLKDGVFGNNNVIKENINKYECYMVNGDMMYLINDGWSSDETKELLNKIGNYQLNIKTIILFGYSFNIAEIKELEIGLKQLDVNINLLKRY